MSFERERQRLLNVNRQLQQEAASLASRLRQYESGVVPPGHTVRLPPPHACPLASTPPLTFALSPM